MKAVKSYVPVGMLVIPLIPVEKLWKIDTLDGAKSTKLKTTLARPWESRYLRTIWMPFIVCNDRSVALPSRRVDGLTLMISIFPRCFKCCDLKISTNNQLRAFEKIMG